LDSERLFTGPREIYDDRILDRDDRELDDERFADLDSDEEILFDMDEDERKEHLGIDLEDLRLLTNASVEIASLTLDVSVVNVNRAKAARQGAVELYWHWIQL